MSSNNVRNGLPTRLTHSAFPPAPNQSILLEKVNARTSTPDSEALASSEDEVDHRPENPQATAQPPKPVRRSSWLNDTSQPVARPRKGSFASSSMSPTASHPSTPSAEAAAGTWNPHSSSTVMGRAPPAATGFAWGQGIWNNDRKDPPQRLTEVLPSPTSVIPPGGGNNSFFGPDSTVAANSPATREPAPNSQIPFAIPLHPTPKTYRSQSYSAGQLDPEMSPGTTMSSSTMMSRGRHPALQHRPSRPSMLSEMNDGSILGKVKEVDDDDEDESPTGSLQNSMHQSAESKTIEMLTRENALLRQQSQQQQQQLSARIRSRGTAGSGYPNNGYPLREYVPEESDYAIDELDEANESGEAIARRAANRRMSEYGGSVPYRSPIGVEGRKPEVPNLKKALWSSTPGIFANDISQSRRHSFANMPTRQGSVTSLVDSGVTLEAPAADVQTSQAYQPGYPDTPSYNSAANGAFFSLGANMNGSGQPVFNTAYLPQFGLPNQFAMRPPSPHRSAYGVPQPRHNQLLHVVLFKCARADVFYIQEGTGLTVKPGDLVIVEADRGTDLGTVARDNVDWQAAKELKEHYAEEQYKWLMMYSQNAAAAQEGSGAGLLASNGLQGGAVGGMGPPGQHHMQEPTSGELRPKLIKRLAQNHEVHSLRDKEGQEAKAKRVCMQKVKEHGLNMEILDAEFQMDWKKLTFYYFADSYINFNSLVTDLFKIYKTRIWMSAINPASFASPTLGIQAPSGVGPGAVGVSRAASGNERRQNQPSQQEQQSQIFSAGAQIRAPRAGFNQSPAVGDRQAPPNSGYPPSNYGYGPAGVFGNARLQGAYIAGVTPSVEGFAAVNFPQQGDFQSIRQRFPQAPGVASGVTPLSPQNDWNAAFQSLSLNTH